MTPENNNANHSDELRKILEEYGAADGGTADVPAREPEGDGIDDAISIISSGREDTGKSAISYADIKESGEESEDAVPDEVPESLFSHLSDEGAAVHPDGSPANPHFTESFTPVEAPAEAESTEGDGSRRESGLKKAGRIFQKLSLLPKVVIYIAVVLAVSAYLSYYIISIANDVFAFVSTDREVRIEIAEGATDEEVAKLLEDSGLIEYGWVYKLYMRYRGSGDSSTEYIAGEHTLNSNYNYSQIITALTTKTVKREVVRITIPEGYTVDQMIDLFVSKGLGEKEKFIAAINEYPYKHEFVQLLTEKGYPETRKYRLEGYLFPDTYDFYNTASEVFIVNTLLNNFNNRFWKDYVKEDGNGESYRDMMLNSYGMDFDDIVILASMVQAEGKTAEDFEYISYVFHNRLSHSGSFPKLESDATIQYALEVRETDSSKIDVSYETPYNTYLYDGLPPGAICNPGLDAFTAAMFPSAPLNEKDKAIDAYFFVSNNAGKTYYASSRSGHEKNKAQVAKDNEAIESSTYED